MNAYFADCAWLSTGPVQDVRIEIADGRFVAVAPEEAMRAGDTRLPGVTFPGLANTHSHAFHRALRGRTHGDGGTFWTWREQMYQIAAALTPDNYYRLARAVFGEMALAGITGVGEFHYVHHARDGRPYAEPNAMGHAVIRAARDAGIRITLLDACYLAGGLGPDGHLPLSPEQRRFGDGDAHAWAARFAQLIESQTESDTDTVRIGAAIHSVRAVPRDQFPAVVAAARGRPLHVHLSEQRAENEQCQAVYGQTPTELLDNADAWGPQTCAAHATHLDAADIDALGRSGTSISFCPTTERDLADGIGPSRKLRDSGAPLTLGSDQNAVIDLFEEVRGLEMDERLASNRRGNFTPAELVEAMTSAGHRALGWPDAGRIEVGARADLVAVHADSLRTAGARKDQLIYAATAADVHTVIVDGRLVVRDGRHEALDVPAALAAALTELDAIPPP